MRVQEIMNPSVTLSPRTSVREAAEALVGGDATEATVVDGLGRLVGIVSEADLLRGRLAPDPRRHIRAVDQERAPLAHEVGEVMTQDVRTVGESADVAEVTDLMLEHRLRAVPVVAGQHVVGMVTRRDVLRLVTRDDDELLADVRTALAAGSGAGRWDVEVAEGSVLLRGTSRDAGVAQARARSVPGVARADVEPAEAASATDHAGLRVLPFSECLDRIRSVKLGRLGLLDGGEVVILPVNHALDGTTVVFRSAEGSKLGAIDRGVAVAFEVDGYETVRRAGWSVLVQGNARRVEDDAEVRRLDGLGLDPWADREERPVWVRIIPNQVTGRSVLH